MRFLRFYWPGWWGAVPVLYGPALRVSVTDAPPGRLRLTAAKGRVVPSDSPAGAVRLSSSPF